MNTKTEKTAKITTNFKSIRIKSETKDKIDKKLSSINKSEEFGKVNYDRLIQFFLESITPESIQSLQNSTITWKLEEPRLMKLWSKINRKTTTEEWKEMLYMGKLQDFIKEHSRIATK